MLFDGFDPPKWYEKGNRTRSFGLFGTFNPLKGKVPGTPFPLLPWIAETARDMLKHRTLEQIIYAAEVIDWIIKKGVEGSKGNAQSLTTSGKSSFELPLLDHFFNLYTLEGNGINFVGGAEWEYITVFSLLKVAAAANVLRYASHKNEYLIAANFSLEALQAKDLAHMRRMFLISIYMRRRRSR